MSPSKIPAGTNDENRQGRPLKKQRVEQENLAVLYSHLLAFVSEIGATSMLAPQNGPGPPINYWTWISWTKSVLKVVENPCSFRDEDSSGEPETLSCSARPLEVMEDLLKSRRRKGAFFFWLWEEKRNDYLKVILYFSLARKEWDPLEQL